MPTLNLQNLPEYVSSSEEEEDEGDEPAQKLQQTDEKTKEATNDEDML